MSDRPVALVTGASRGIGRACARHLAAAGFDVAVAARTVNEGDAAGGLPGSLEAVAAEVEAAGARALRCRLDLLEPASCEAAVEVTRAELGGVDVLVNSGIYYGASGMNLFVDTPMQEYREAFAANVLAPMQLVQLVAPSMSERGGGLVVNVSSGAGQNETKALPGEGGWPLSYSVTKAAINRATAGMAKELRRDSIAVVNLEPGVVATERMTLVTTQQGIPPVGVSVDVPGSVCAYLATHATPMAFSGRTVDAPQFCVWAGLVPGDEVPYPYGPSVWGAPALIPSGGAAIGVESGVPMIEPEGGW